ncbi:MAG: DUF692 domain-containing protein [Deltaproteobacteria bacterium]|nr:DUF692 domain-containing protein [Deltaproteobacteria bacterium]
MPPADRSRRGVGLGLRWEFLEDLVERVASGSLTVDELPFIEVAPENYLRRGGYVVEAFEFIASRIPVLSHGLHLSLGGLEPFAPSYLAELRRFLERFDAPWHSDHLCFSSVDGRMLHELLPMPRTEDAALHVAARIREVRARLGRPFALENISWYRELGESELDEPTFLARVLEEADCGLLLDVNNVQVNAKNHGFSATEWLARVETQRVWQLHVAGHEHRASEGLFVDTHGAPVEEPVVDLMCATLLATGPLPVVLERDTSVPSLEELLAERSRLQRSYDEAIAEHARRTAIEAPHA